MMRKGFHGHIRTCTIWIVGLIFFFNAFFITSIDVNAATTEDGLFEYEISDDSTYITITGWNGDYMVHDAIIPADIDGIPVTKIGEKAFYRKSYIYNLVIPDSVTECGEYAFHYCVSLSSVVMSSQLTYISRGMFAECHTLTTIDIPDGIKLIKLDGFFDTSLAEVVIPASVEEIQGYAFNRYHNYDELDPFHFYCYSVKTKFDKYFRFDDDTIIHCYEGSDIDKWAKNNGYDSSKIVYFGASADSNSNTSNSGGAGGQTLPNTATYDNRNILISILSIVLVLDIIISLAKRNYNR